MARRRRSSLFLGGRRRRSATDKLAAQAFAFLVAVGFLLYIVQEFGPILVVVGGGTIAWVIYQAL